MNANPATQTNIYANNGENHNKMPAMFVLLPEIFFRFSQDKNKKTDNQTGLAAIYSRKPVILVLVVESREYQPANYSKQPTQDK